ncbi:MAG TPA: DNA mismatch repair endonuclease MutL [Treponema sp.]|nr:DNA mismatch repair endonuclease MutL [Treponema sp.]
MSAEHPVRRLNAEVARKIAAGEVIDRPNAIVRELMDNAIDSGAGSVHVEVDAGGIEKVRVVDNGCGMTKEDLAACARPHATSKITTETDLLKLSTLGFRGEALSSIAAVCRLSVSSGTWKMRASVTEDHIIEPVPPVSGTIVQAEGLFENFPARRLFLKRPASEMLMCRTTFIEKSLPRPDIAFTFTADGERRLTLERGVPLRARFVQATEQSENESLFYEISGNAGGEKPDWSFTVVIGEPGIFRSNKKDIYIFVNGRRIAEYSLVQAIEYGGQGYFPNGTYPVAALFVTMNPEFVDFNIHPAKKEARFKDLSGLHHGVSTAVRDFFHHYTVKTMTDRNAPEDAVSKSPELDLHADAAGTPYTKGAPDDTAGRIVMHRGGINFHTPGESGYRVPLDDVRSRFFSGRTGGAGDAPEAFKRGESPYSAGKDKNEPQSVPYVIEHLSDNVQPLADAALSESPPVPFHFIGSALGTFLIAEKDETLYIIDKHAAHERILYNRIMADQGKSQELLVPYEITTENEADDAYLSNIQDELKRFGFTVKNCGSGRWEISSVPERWKGTENDLYHTLLDRRLEPSEVISAIAAMSACKAAVKDGGFLDDDTATQLVAETFALPDPHCPHGRPVWTTITRDQLFALVKRT